MIQLFGRTQKKSLQLSDFHEIWTKFCFLDESGSLSNPKDPFFTLGFIKCSQPYYLQSKIMYERQKRRFYDEIKFNKLSKNNFTFAQFALDSFLATRSVEFHSYSLDKEGEYFQREFSGDSWRAYEDIAIRILKSTVPENEILIVIADYVTTPGDVRFEVNVKRRVNQELKRLAIAGVCRFDSKSNDMLQLADLLVGAITYDLKLASGVILQGDKYKKRFLEYLRGNMGIANQNLLDLEKGFRNYIFNIFIDKDAKRRLPFSSTPEIDK